MKYVNSFLLSMTVALFSASSVFAFSGSYEQVISIQGQEMARFMVQAKGDNVRTDLISGEQKESVIKNAEGTYRIIPAQNIALKMPEREDSRNLLDDLDNYAGFLEENKAEKVSTEEIYGKTADVYSFLDPVTEQQSRAWVNTENGLPMKIEVQAPEGTIMIELLNLKVSEDLDDSLFALPEGFKVVELEAMLQQMAAQQAMAEGAGEQGAEDAAPAQN